MRSAIRIVAALAAAITFLTAAGSASARVVQSFGTAGADRLRFPDRIVYGPDGLLHVVDFGDAVRDPVFVRLYTPKARGLAVSGSPPARSFRRRSQSTPRETPTSRRSVRC